MTSFKEFVSIALVEGSRNQKYDVIDLVRVRDVVEEFCKVSDGLGTKIIELIDEFFDGFFRDDRGGDGRRDVGKKVAVLGR